MRIGGKAMHQDNRRFGAFKFQVVQVDIVDCSSVSASSSVKKLCREIKLASAEADASN